MGTFDPMQSRRGSGGELGSGARGRRRVSQILVGALLLAAVGCEEPRVFVPDSLRGRWTTSAPAYAGRALQIRTDRLIFETGEGESMVVISGVEEVEPLDGRRRYVIHYTDAYDEPLTLRVLLDPSPPGRLQIENRNQVWSRAN
jgi:hypothetical protein